MLLFFSLYNYKMSETVEYSKIFIQILIHSKPEYTFKKICIFFSQIIANRKLRGKKSMAKFRLPLAREGAHMALPFKKNFFCCFPIGKRILTKKQIFLHNFWDKIYKYIKKGSFFLSGRVLTPPLIVAH